MLAFSCCAPDVVDGMSLGDGLLTLCSSLSLSRECEDEIRRRLPCVLTAGIRSQERLDDEIDEPADPPAPRVSLLLASFLMASAASLSASLYSSCPG